MTPLTAHSIFLVDLGDNTIAAYNRRGGISERGVIARLVDVRTLPLVQETFGQIDDALKLCKNTGSPAVKK